MTGQDAGRPGPLPLREFDELAGRTGDISLTVEDVVLLVLRADPRPVEGLGRLTEEVLLALRGPLSGPDVEPAVFERGPGGRVYSLEVERALDRLDFSNCVKAVGDAQDPSAMRFEIAPRGASRIEEKWGALSPDARRVLAQKRKAERDEAEAALLAAVVDPVYVHNEEMLRNRRRAAAPGASDRGESQASETPAHGGADAAKFQEYLNRGDHLYGEEKYDEAYAAYEMASRLQAPDVGLHFKMARSLAGMELYKDALEHCRAAIKADPAYAGGHVAMAYCLHRLGRHSEALPHSMQAVLRGPSTPQAYIVRGAILSKLGRHSEALPHYQRALLIDPGSTEARQNVSDSLLQLGRYKEALPHAEHLARMSPEDPVAHARIVACLSRMGRHDDAVLAGRRAVEAAPDRVDSYLPITTPLFALKSHKEVLQWSARALAVDPSDPRPHFAASLSLRELGRHEEALDHCRRAADLGASDANLHLLMSYLLRDLGRFDEALFHCKAVVTAGPGDPHVLSDTGGILSDMGNHKEALVCFDRALRIDPRQPAARYNRALSLQSTGRLDEALGEYKKVVEIDPGSIVAYNNMGTVLAALGMDGEALAHFDRAIELEPGNAAAHHNKALVLQRLDLNREALAHFDRALELNPGNAGAYVGRLSCMSELGLPDREIGQYAGEDLGPTAASRRPAPAAAEQLTATAVSTKAKRMDDRHGPASGTASGGDRSQLVKSLLSKDESEVLEFKSWPGSRRERPPELDKMKGKIARTLCSFANTRGGDLLIGVGDGGKVEGLAPGSGRLSRKERDKMLAWVTDVIVGHLGAGLGGYFDREIVEVAGCDILHCFVTASKNGPVILKKKIEGRHDFFIRVGSECSPLASKEMLEYVKSKWPDWAFGPRPMGQSTAAQKDMTASAVNALDMSFSAGEL